MVSELKTEITGTEKKKMFPSDIGIVVTDFLQEHFPNVMDYGFTAEAEKEFDNIAQGQREWNEMIEKFYGPFKNNVEHTLEESQRATGERLLGQDPKTGANVYARIGRFGPMVQMGETDSEDKPRFAKIVGDASITSISLEEALELFSLPRNVGEFEGKEVIIGAGRFGPYVRHDGKFVSLGKLDPHAITLDQSIELIKMKREEDANRIIKEFSENKDVQVLNGRYGPYIKVGKKNVKIPKDTEPSELTLEECLKLAENAPAKKRFRKKKA